MRFKEPTTGQELEDIRKYLYHRDKNECISRNGRTIKGKNGRPIHKWSANYMAQILGLAEVKKGPTGRRKEGQVNIPRRRSREEAWRNFYKQYPNVSGPQKRMLMVALGFWTITPALTKEEIL